MFSVEITGVAYKSNINWIGAVVDQEETFGACFIQVYCILLNGESF